MGSGDAMCNILDLLITFHFELDEKSLIDTIYETAKNGVRLRAMQQTH